MHVISSDIIWPHVVLKGKSLNKDDLTSGLKQDQTLHTLIALEYNTRISSYAYNVLTDVEIRCNLNAS